MPNTARKIDSETTLRPHDIRFMHDADCLASGPMTAKHKETHQHREVLLEFIESLVMEMEDDRTKAEKLTCGHDENGTIASYIEDVQIRHPSGYLVKDNDV